MKGDKRSWDNVSNEWVMGKEQEGRTTGLMEEGHEMKLIARDRIIWIALCCQLMLRHSVHWQGIPSHLRHWYRYSVVWISRIDHSTVIVAGTLLLDDIFLDKSLFYSVFLCHLHLLWLNSPSLVLSSSAQPHEGSPLNRSINDESGGPELGRPHPSFDAHFGFQQITRFHSRSGSDFIHK